MKIDPMTLCREYDPKFGDVGRGYKNVSPNDVDLTGWEQYSTPGKSGPEATDLPIYDQDGKPTAVIWNGWIKRDNGKTWVIGFERPMTDEEKAIPRPVYPLSGGPPEFSECPQ